MCTYKMGVFSRIEEYNVRWVYTKFVWDKCYTNVILVTLCQRVCVLVSCYEMSETSFM